MSTLLSDHTYNGSSVISQNLKYVQDMLYEALLAAGRDVSSVQLMAVSKTVPIELIQKAHSCGQMLFGENKVQEAVRKFTDHNLNTESPYTRHRAYQGMELHLIGTLQRNKVNRAVQFFDCIQSIDRMSVLDAVVDQLKENQQYDNMCGQNSTDAHVSEHSMVLNKYPIYLQVRSSDYDYKNGFDSTDILFQAVERVLESDCLQLKGLMTIGPFSHDERIVRRAFEKTRCWNDTIQEQFKITHLLDISMGMSVDFAWAILEGSTLIRIGSSIFGARL